MKRSQFDYLKDSRILFVCLDSKWGAKEEFLLEDALMLRQRGFPVWFFVFSGCPLASLAKNHDFPVIEIEENPNRRFSMAWTRLLRKHLEKLAITVTHAVGTKSLYCAGWAVRKFPSVPLFYSHYGSSLKQKNPLLARFIFPRVDLFLVPHRGLISNVCWSFRIPSKKVKVVPLALSQLFNQKIEGTNTDPIEWLPGDRLIFTALGSSYSKKQDFKPWIHGFGRMREFWQERGYLLLVKHRSELMASQEVELARIQDSEEWKVFEPLISQYRLEGRIGMVEATDQGVFRLIQASRGVVFTNYPRYGDINPLHAMAFGKPIGLAESSLAHILVGEDRRGKILPRRDTLALSRVLAEWILSGPELEETGKRAEEFVRVELREEVRSEALLSAYRRGVRRRYRRRRKAS
jgi:glycosyltransferase involved in cell wall biosynthesis